MRHDLDAILTQPVVKVEAAAEKAPAALETQARPQRPGGQPYRPPQPEVIVRTEKKSSPLLWAAVVVLAVLAAWLYYKQPKSDAEAASQTLPAVTPASIPVPAPIPITPPQEPASTTKVAKAPPAAPVPAVKVTAGVTTATTSNPAEATKDRPFVNSLGMKFVPVPGTKVLMCIHETRHKDYAAYATQNSGVNSRWRTARVPEVPKYIASDDAPLFGVNWNESKAFCEWLSRKEDLAYRLPSDREWSHAVGIADQESVDVFPAELGKANNVIYPWGQGWPPSAGAGNFSDESVGETTSFPGYIRGYNDKHPGPSPVMSFRPNKLGLYDLGGNVSEWCEDWYDHAKKERVLRDSTWYCDSPTVLLSSRRFNLPPDYAGGHIGRGFRCVLEVASQPNLTTKAPVVPTAAPQPTQAAATTVSTSLSTVGDPPNTTKMITDLLPLVEVTRDAVNGAWSKVSDGLRVEVQNQPRIPAQVQFPYAIKTVEYDYTVEFSFAADNAREMRQSFPAAGKSLNWSMQVFPSRTPVHYSFTRLDGVVPAFAKDAFTTRPLLAAASRHRSVIKVRGNSLTAEIDGETFVHWQGDLRRFDADRQLRVPGSTDFQVFDGGIIIHKATITEFVPQPASPALPTGPTTWTDTKGRSITATFKAIASGNVLLDIAGKVTPVPLNTLSAESQKLARDLEVAMPKAASIAAGTVEKAEVKPPASLKKSGWRSLLDECPDAFTKVPFQDSGDGWKRIQVGFNSSSVDRGTQCSDPTEGQRLIEPACSMEGRWRRPAWFQS
jgi:formylglycine-generating enzyme required for sulfatase activity